jgi:hypothetical protein
VLLLRRVRRAPVLRPAQPAVHLDDAMRSDPIRSDPAARDALSGGQRERASTPFDGTRRALAVAPCAGR